MLVVYDYRWLFKLAVSNNEQQLKMNKNEINEITIITGEFLMTDTFQTTRLSQNES